VKRIDDQAGLDAAIASGKTAVLFHATWCPYCREFRPVFEDLTAGANGTVPVEAVLDDEESPLWAAYGIDIVPTVILFHDGRPGARAEGRPGVGLTRAEVEALLARS
jgi:thioredoxin 1